MHINYNESLFLNDTLRNSNGNLEIPNRNFSNPLLYNNKKCQNL